MVSEPNAPTAILSTRAIRTGFSALIRPPFAVLWALSLLLAAASSSIKPRADEATLVASVILALVSLYLEIAVILAAGRREPERSADTWVKGAFRRRCFWRFFVTGVIVDISVALGLLGLIVGSFILASMLGLAAPAAVIERRLPLQAIARSFDVATPARRAVGTVYGLLILIPTLALQVSAFTNLVDAIAFRVALGCIVATMTMAGVIALTRIFTALGGDHTPSPNELRPPPPIQPTP